jgi:AraC-like DNA-binding protein
MDVRVQQAREHHRLAADSERLAGVHREQRDRMIRQLWAEERNSWTYAKLALAVGCSPQLIAHIITGPVSRRG